MLNRSDLITAIEKVLSRVDQRANIRLLRQFEPLREFLAGFTRPEEMLTPEQMMDAEEVYDLTGALEHIEIAHFFVALVRTFHDDLECEALPTLINLNALSGSETPEAAEGFLRPFIILFKVGLLTPQNVLRLMEFESEYPDDHRDTNHLILSWLTETDGILTQPVFDLVFSQQNLEQISLNNVPCSKRLAGYYRAMHSYLSFDSFVFLSKHPEKCLPVFNWVVNISDKQLLSDVMLAAVDRNIAYCEEMLKIAAQLDKTVSPEIFHTQDCMISLCGAAQYFTKLDLLLKIFQQHFALTPDYFILLCNYVVQTKGQIVDIAYVLFEDTLQNLLTLENIEKLPTLFPFILSAHAAIAVLAYRRKLTQEILDEIIKQPINALFVAARVIGIPQLRSLTEDEIFKSDHCRAVSVIENFIYLRMSSRYFCGPLLRLFAQGASSVPDDVLGEITRAGLTPGLLESNTALHIYRTSLSK